MNIHPTFLEASGESTSRILIRSEYDAAEQTALLAGTGRTGVQVFLVDGQPGIGLPYFPHLQHPSTCFLTSFSGKSIFLFRPLIRRLSLELPTIFQHTPDQALLFHSGGVYEFEQLSYAGPYTKLRSSDPHENIWALIDLNTTLIQPGGVFIERSPFFVVEATSRRNRRLEWAQKTVPKCFDLSPWTFPEVAQAYVILPVTTQRQYLHSVQSHSHKTHAPSWGTAALVFIQDIRRICWANYLSSHTVFNTS